MGGEWMAKVVLVGILCFLVNASVLALAMSAYPWVEKAVFGRGSWWLSQPLFVRIVYVVVLAPFFEELIHRQFILNYFLRNKRPILGLIVSSATFGLHHYLTGWGWLKVVDMFFVGIVFGWAYITHRLAGSWLCHTSNNLLVVISFLG